MLIVFRSVLPAVGVAEILLTVGMAGVLIAVVGFGFGGFALVGREETEVALDVAELVGMDEMELTDDLRARVFGKDGRGVSGGPKEGREFVDGRGRAVAAMIKLVFHGLVWPCRGHRRPVPDELFESATTPSESGRPCAKIYALDVQWQCKEHEPESTKTCSAVLSRVRV